MRNVRERDYYTVAEAADILGVSPSTIWRWIKAGRLPAYRVGHKTIRIKQQDLATAMQPAKEVRMEQEREQIWARYDPDKVEQALKESAGALRGVDTDQLIAEIYQAREQGDREHLEDDAVSDR